MKSILKNGYKKITRVIIVISVLFACLFYNNALAFPMPSHSVGSSRIIQNSQVFIDGKKIQNINKTIVITTDKPILFGYTLDNVKIKLDIKSKDRKFSSTQTIISDSSGYWIYHFEEKLERNVYEVFITLSDATNISSETVKVGTFEIPEVLPKIIRTSLNKRVAIPIPSLNNLNYLTVSLIIIGAVILKIIFYLMVRIIHSVESRKN